MLLDAQTEHPSMRSPQLLQLVPTRVKPLLQTRQVVPVLQLLHPLMQAEQRRPFR